MISAGQKVNKLMQDFFTAYFNERDYKAAAGFLREDIRWIGLGAVCSARDRSEAVKFLQAEIAAAPYAVFFEYENVQNVMLSETAAVFLCDLLLKKNKDGYDSDISIRVMAACNCCDSVWKIAALHVSQANMGPGRQVIFSRQRSVWKRLPRSKAALTGKCWVCLTAVYQVVF